LPSSKRPAFEAGLFIAENKTESVTFYYDNCLYISMAKTFLLLFLLCTTALSWGQPTPENSTAKVAVTVTDMKGKLQRGEEVLFISKKSARNFSCRTDRDGKASTTLPVGDIYTIKLKTLTDTTMYSSFEIPALQPGHFYKAPFQIEIEFEPPRSFTLDNVHFDTGKPTLRPESFKELNEIAEYLKWREDEAYEIAGHTDNVGKDADNLKLSQARAAAVKDYLVKKGITVVRLTAKGYGASKPVADNSTEEGRQANRRTELKIL
jgi:outer membrane protein OmpA-like peptidoglycan-associated protein